MGREPFRRELDLRLASKRPARLLPETEWRVLSAPLPAVMGRSQAGPPEASIVVLTHDNLVFTRMCLESVLVNTEGPDFELIVVDHASSDGTTDYLLKLASRDGRVLPVLLDANRGFAAGVNAGLRAARGRWFVMLNNDTVVAPCWLTRLLRHLADPSVGLVGPVTNQAPGIARVGDEYGTYGEFVKAAGRRGRTFGPRDVETLTLFCAALPRRVYETVGPLDERFELGMFEDDDYCLRIGDVGLKCRLAEDVLVHHFSEATFGHLVADGTWKSVFDSNRRRFEQKWERSWAGHTARDESAYMELLVRMRGVVETLPDCARVLVASRGDDRLCVFPGRVAGHFPQMPDGTYAGSYPADDAGAIRHLEDLSARGWTHLALPNPARWWLDHYPLMTHHLEGYGVVLDDPAAGIVFRISS